MAAPVAGLAANDSLVILDEAHCPVPFLQTLEAVEIYRGRDWAEAPVPSPFAFVALSATPPAGLPSAATFPGQDPDAALDHPELDRRLRASKRAELVEIEVKKSDSEDPLVDLAARRAVEFLKQDKSRVAVMVNRVRTAGEVASALRDRLGDAADVVLLTGRLRPFERDQLVERWTPFLRANSPSEPARPILLVTTQCLEVAADFSFDALVSEAASLDALRQRFGRLDRLGRAGASPAAILIRSVDSDPKKAEPDPIYGSALSVTWKLLSERAENCAVDFGARAGLQLGVRRSQQRGAHYRQ